MSDQSEEKIVVESPVKLHLRPTSDVVGYFVRLQGNHPAVQVCLQLDSIDPGFDEERDQEECDDPTSMTKAMMFFGKACMGWDTEKRFRVVLRGEKEAVSAIVQTVRDELRALAATWTKYTIENRTIHD